MEIEKYFQEGKSDNRALYIAILKDAGINENFINSSAGFEALSSMIDQTRNNGGIDFEGLTAENVPQLVEKIKSEWHISENYVMANTPLLDSDKEPRYGAQNRQTSRATALTNLGDGKIQIDNVRIDLENNYGEEAQNYNYEDMPYILENDNRVEETVDQEVYQMYGGDEDELISSTNKTRVSTLKPEDFERLQGNVKENELRELYGIQHKPDEYWSNSISKTPEYSELRVTPYSELFNFSQKQNIESKQYTQEDLNAIMENIFKDYDSQTIQIQWGDTLSELANKFETTVEALAQANGIENPDLIYAGNNLTIPGKTPTREEAINQALQQLGVSNELLKFDSNNNNYINKMVEKTIVDNPEIGDITTKEGMEKLIEQLSQDLVIGENYIAGRYNVPDKLLQENMDSYGKNADTYSRQDVGEIYIDDKGLIHQNSIVLTQTNDLENNPSNQSIFNVPECLSNDNVVAIWTYNDLYNKEGEKLTSQTRGKFSTIKNGAYLNFNLQDVIGLENTPSNEWDMIKATQIRPDIIVKKEKQKAQQEKQKEQTDIQVDEAKEDELIQSYDNYDITTEDMQVAHDTLEQTLEEGQTQQQVQTNEDEGR